MIRSGGSFGLGRMILLAALGGLLLSSAGCLESLTGGGGDSDSGSCPQATLLSPLEGDRFKSGANLSLRWISPGTETAGYELHVWGPGLDWTTSGLAAQRCADENEDCNFGFFVLNTAGYQAGTFSWAVRSVCPKEATGEWSSPLSFILE